MSRYRIVPEDSRIWAEARSSLHPIRVETHGLRGHLDAEVVDDHLADGAPVTGRVEIEADRLRTGNGLYDHELERRLEIRKYPTIQGQVREVRSLGDGRRYHITGDLVFHGITRPVEGDVRLRVLDDGRLEIEGERAFDIRQHGLEPPKILMLKVHPEVQVRARVIAEREG